MRFKILNITEVTSRIHLFSVIELDSGICFDCETTINLSDKSELKQKFVETFEKIRESTDVKVGEIL